MLLRCVEYPFWYVLRDMEYFRVLHVIEYFSVLHDIEYFRGLHDISGVYYTFWNLIIWQLKFLNELQTSLVGLYAYILPPEFIPILIAAEEQAQG